jgi:3-oxoacyl-[acyl-carrier-protein] synthase-1
MKVFINHYSIISALGSGLVETRNNLFAGVSPGMTLTDNYSPGNPIYLGLVKDELPSLANFPIKHRSRNNQLLLAALNQLDDQFRHQLEGVDKSRVAVIIGSSTSGISEEEGVFPSLIENGKFPDSYDLTQRLFCSPANFLADCLGVTGPVYGISTACTSSAKAIASGARLLKTRMVDLVIAGGADSLCKFTVAGFNAIESISRDRCNPLSVNRSGINIGEGAALFVMTREDAHICLSGWGESSDGYHISAPDPNGIGPALAINGALKMAGKNQTQIEYINLHGTATRQNDSMEATLVAKLGFQSFVSSTKPILGHALGAAGAIEAAICCLTLSDNGRLPPHIWDGEQDPMLPILKLAHNLASPPKVVMSNNFAFGGNNTSLILETV